MIIAIDVETKGLNAREFLLGCAIKDNGKEVYFYSSKEMRKWLLEQCEYYNKYGKKVYIYAHNHQFDFYAYMKGDLYNKDFKTYRWSPLLSMYKQKNYFLDTMAFYRMSLKEVGEIIDLPKLETPEELINGEDVDLESVKPYLYRDTLIVLKAMQMFKEKVNELGFKPRKMITAGQVAMSSFMSYLRRNNLQWFISNKGKVYESKYHEKIRLAFRGGRVQSFRNEFSGNAYQYDQNSQHPYVETQMDFPDLQSEKYIVNPVRLTNKIGVSKVKVYSPPNNLNLPFLPIYWDGRQIYPKNCSMTGVWTNEELRIAVKLGYEIKKIYWTIEYNKLEVNPLRNYQLELWNMRKNCDNQMKMVIKLLMNSFGMKFAQRNKQVEYQFCRRSRALEYMSSGYEFGGTIDNMYVMIKNKGYYYPNYYNPIISCLITANARISQYKEMNKIPKEDLLYCDTDSILCINDHSDKLNMGNELGEWKVEASNELFNCKGEKKYYIGNKVKISGVPKDQRLHKLIDSDSSVTVKRIYSFNKAIQGGSMERVGTFEDFEISLESESKLTMKYPEVIIEDE